MLIYFVHLLSHALHYVWMFQESVEHEGANTGRGIHAHQIRGKNIGEQVRFR